jgi:hypothetical protein
MRLALRSLMVVLMGAVLLIAPFDCFASTGFTRAAADCCAKGKCLPTQGSDDCCKHAVPGGNDFVKVSNQVLIHILGPLQAITVTQSFLPTLSSGRIPWFALAASPPGSPPLSRLNLPLLI